MNKLIFAVALAAIATPLPAASTSASSPIAAEARLGHISIVKLGSGPPVVLVPGLASPRAVWDGVTEDLARNHTVHLVQVNGFGGSAAGANLQPGILDGIVADLDRYLTREKVARVRIVGHSMGGLAALMFARAHPRRVEQMMIVDALPYFAVLMTPGQEPTADRVEPVARMMRGQVAARYGKPIGPEAIQADIAGLALKASSRDKMAAWAADADARVTAQLLYEDLTTDLRPSLTSIQAPMTILVPWTDTGFGKDRTLAFYRRQYVGAPNVAYADIGDSGHMVMLDQPERFRAALADFLK